MISADIKNSNGGENLELASFCKFFPKHKFLKLIGKGATGIVALAENQKGHKVAVKKMNFNSSTFYQCKKVLREVSILRQLSSMTQRHFTRLLDVKIDKGEDLWSIYFELEYMEMNLK